MKDHTGQSLAYVYFEEEGGERRTEAVHHSTALPSSHGEVQVKGLRFSR